MKASLLLVLLALGFANTSFADENIACGILTNFPHVEKKILARYNPNETKNSIDLFIITDKKNEIALENYVAGDKVCVRFYFNDKTLTDVQNLIHHDSGKKIRKVDTTYHVTVIDAWEDN